MDLYYELSIVIKYHLILLKKLAFIIYACIQRLQPQLIAFQPTNEAVLK